MHTFSKSSRSISAETKEKHQQFWRYFVYLVIDEISMILKTSLAMLSCHIGIGKVGTGEAVNSDSFGGINAIFYGDFHQFPPVTCAASEALHQPQNMKQCLTCHPKTHSSNAMEQRVSP